MWRTCRIAQVVSHGDPPGARSDTLDADGRIEVEASPRVPSLFEIQQAIAPLWGAVDPETAGVFGPEDQGRRAYDLARAGQAVELAPRLVRIDRIAVLRYAWPHLELEIDCGGGTYIRSIARDIGEALGCGGYVETLVRTRTGPFTLEQPIDPAALSTESIGRIMLRPALDAVPDLPRLALDAGQVAGRHPGPAAIDTRPGPEHHPSPAGQVALLDPDGDVVALGELDPERGWIQPRKVLV